MPKSVTPRVAKPARPRLAIVKKDERAKDERPRRVKLAGISPRAWEHPSDRAALAAMRAVPGFDAVVRRLFGLIGDRPLRHAFLASAVRVSARQFPDLHRRHLEACRILDVTPVPELFVAQTPFVNAGAIGLDRPFVVLQSGSLGLLEGDELSFVLGHELGHVASGHALYKTMLRLLLRLGQAAFAIPLGGPALLAVVAALLEWDRCSELSADRAGLLVVQSPDVAMRVTMKLAGGGRTEEMNVAEFEAQAREYEKSGSVVDSVMKMLSLLGQPHPFPVLRLAELRRFVDAGTYDEIVGGTYPRRADDGARHAGADFAEAADRWQEEFRTSRDPLVETLREASQKAQWVAAALGRTMRDALRPDPPPDPPDPPRRRRR